MKGKLQREMVNLAIVVCRNPKNSAARRLGCLWDGEVGFVRILLDHGEELGGGRLGRF